MPAELILAPEAALDLAEAYSWYEECKTGLGEDFLACVEAAVESIRSAPARYAVVDGECRRALVRRFPYAIFFEGEQRKVTIYAVFHASRDPEKWRSRLTQ
jgi:plasmid stabilization system protein ParE